MADKVYRSSFFDEEPGKQTYKKHLISVHRDELKLPPSTDDSRGVNIHYTKEQLEDMKTRPNPLAGNWGGIQFIQTKGIIIH